MATTHAIFDDPYQRAVVGEVINIGHVAEGIRGPHFNTFALLEGSPNPYRFSYWESAPSLSLFGACWPIFLVPSGSLHILR